MLTLACYSKARLQKMILTGRQVATITVRTLTLLYLGRGHRTIQTRLEDYHSATAAMTPEQAGAWVVAQTGVDAKKTHKANWKIQQLNLTDLPRVSGNANTGSAFAGKESVERGMPLCAVAKRGDKYVVLEGKDQLAAARSAQSRHLDSLPQYRSYPSWQNIVVLVAER